MHISGSNEGLRAGGRTKTPRNKLYQKVANCSILQGLQRKIKILLLLLLLFPSNGSKEKARVREQQRHLKEETEGRGSSRPEGGKAEGGRVMWLSHDLRFLE